MKPSILLIILGVLLFLLAFYFRYDMGDNLHEALGNLATYAGLGSIVLGGWRMKIEADNKRSKKD